MRQSDFGAWYFLICIVVGVYWVGDRFGQWVWWLSGLLVVACLFLVNLQHWRTSRAPCGHGTVGAKWNRELCKQCTLEADEKKQADEKKRRVEREKAYRRHIRDIRVPSYLREMDPRDFEKLTCRLYERMGYNVEATPYSGDGGADGLLRKDGELTILQAKRSLSTPMRHLGESIREQSPV